MSAAWGQFVHFSAGRQIRTSAAVSHAMPVHMRAFEGLRANVTGRSSPSRPARSPIARIRPYQYQIEVEPPSPDIAFLAWSIRRLFCLPPDVSLLATYTSATSPLHARQAIAATILPPPTP